MFDQMKAEFDNNAASTEMPRYRCHKEVWALKIASIALQDSGERTAEQESDRCEGGAMIVPAEAGYAPFFVDSDYLRRHRPSIGGYFVVYKDGYKSYSPAEAFEDGYSKI